MYKNKKIILFAFATLDLKKSIYRLKKQANESNYYDTIKILTPKDFDYEIKIKKKNLIKNKKKKRLWLLVLETIFFIKNYE